MDTPLPKPVIAEPTLTDLLHELIAELGGPVAELDRDAWIELAADLEVRATKLPPPASFPQVASQVVAAARKPQLDLNELVGLVQRDGALASAMLRISNSPAFAPASPITTLRGAIQSLGTQCVIEVVVGAAGRSFYDVPSKTAMALFPTLWSEMFDHAMANAFTAGRIALDIPDARGERALLAGLLSDVGRPIALRILTDMIENEGLVPPDYSVVLATLDEVSPIIGERTINAMGLPDELRVACVVDEANPTSDAHIARLVASIGQIQRRGPRIWTSAGDVRRSAERLNLKPRLVRTLFAQRTQYVLQAQQMFGK
jgi:HD-like signal output (HDOD) protein